MAKQSIGALFRLLRPLNVLTVGAVQVLFVQCFSSADMGWAAPAVVGLMLLTAAGNALNDYYDRGTDQINRPHRVILGRHLPAGVGPLLFVLLAGMGVRLGLRMSPILGAIYAATAGILWAYSAWLQRLPLVGNFTVAALLTLPVTVWCAWPEVADCRAALHYGAVIWSINALRELVKDQEDAEGDRRSGYRTLPVISPRAARIVGHALFIATYASTAALLHWVFTEHRDFLWFMLLVLGVMIPLAYLHFAWHHSRRPRQYRIIQKALKGVMVVGAVSMLGACR